jgi:hypothetical protein
MYESKEQKLDIASFMKELVPSAEAKAAQRFFIVRRRPT